MIGENSKVLLDRFLLEKKYLGILILSNNMNIKFLPKFNKGFSMLSFSDQQSVKETIILFRDNPHDPSLHNHPLDKPMIGKRSISAGDDLRIIFRER